MLCRDESRFDELKKVVPSEYHTNLAPFKADLSKESDAIALRQEILRLDGQLNHVVASCGGGWRTDGPLSDLSVEQYTKVLTDYTLPHFICFKTFAKQLAQTPNSTYMFITGGSCESKVFDPKACMVPITTGTQYGLFTASNSEFARNKNLAIVELRLSFWIRKELDAKFEQKKAKFEVGHDYVGKFVPKLIVKHKSDVYKIQDRTVGDQLFNSLA